MTEIDALKERLTRASKDPRLLMLPDVRAALGELVPVLDEVAELRRDVQALANAVICADDVCGSLSHAIWQNGQSGRSMARYGVPMPIYQELKRIKGSANHAQND